MNLSVIRLNKIFRIGILLAGLVSPQVNADEDLSKFQFVEPEFTAEEKREMETAIEAAKAFEANDKMQSEQFSGTDLNTTNYIGDAWSTTNFNLFDAQYYLNQELNQFETKITLYQNSPAVGKQFLTVTQKRAGSDDKEMLRFVFAISAGGKGRFTPDGNHKILKQRWRHMSLTYPSKGENNMDHVSYFAPVIGFHSTVFGLYKKLGTPDSHGCVRMARPEARAVYSVVRANPAQTTVISHPANKKIDPPAEMLAEVKRLLKIDLEFIQNELIAKKNKGDVRLNPDSDRAYFSAVKDNRLPLGTIEILPSQDLFFYEEPVTPAAGPGLATNP